MKIDFTNCPINPLKMYGGMNGNKIGIIYNNENYMLKFPPVPKKHKIMSYTNSCISEDVACKIYQSLGIDTQETILGTYKDKVVVACKDFEVDGYRLKDFALLKNTIVSSEQQGYGTELIDILETINSQEIFDKEKLKERFWEMFVIDSFLGNFDRHNGNWGFLINEETGKVKLAPIYDCGSCLYPQNTEETMKHTLSTAEAIEERMYIFPTSAIKKDGVKINYFHFLANTKNPDCLKTLHRIQKNISMSKVNTIIESTEYISDIYKTFLKTMLAERKKCIIDKAIKIQESRKTDILHQKEELKLDNELSKIKL